MDLHASQIRLNQSIIHPHPPSYSPSLTVFRNKLGKYVIKWLLRFVLICFLFRGMLRNGIPRVCFYFCWRERISELFTLPRKGLERNSDCLLLFLFHGGSVADLDTTPDTPDPHVFGPPGSGSFYHQAKIARKTLIPIVLWLLLDFEKDVNVPSKSNKQKNFFF